MREAGVPATVIGCRTDTLITCDHCRRVASLAARYREVAYVWMFARWQRLQDELRAGAAFSAS